MGTNTVTCQSADLAQLCRDYWVFKLDEEPVVGMEHGHEPSRHLMFRESIEDYERRDKANAEYQCRLAKIDRDALSGQDTITAALLQREIDEARERYRLDEHLRPLMFPFGPATYVAYAISHTVLRRNDDAVDYLIRLATVPQYFADFEARLREGVARGHRLPSALLAPILASHESHIAADATASVWYQPIARSPIAKEDKIHAQALALISEKIKPAYEQFAEDLRKLYADNTRDSLASTDSPAGQDYYAFLAQHYTTMDVSAEEMHQLGLREVERIATKIEAVAADAGFEGDVAAYRAHLANDPEFCAPSANALREQVEVLSKRIDSRIPEFFSHIPRMTYGVQSIPEATSSQMPPAYAQPNPADGSTAGIFWVSSLPDRCPSYMHIPLVLHEAWPGHLMHLATLQEMDGLPDFRRHGATGYLAYLEGWALYCESIGEDMGLYQQPHQRYGQLEMEMWRALRLVLDTGIHLHGWSRDQAIELMQQHMTHSKESIAAEVDRYIGLPGQALAYKMGELKIVELRRHAETTLGNAFDLKAFHKCLMTAGPVTMPVLERHVHDWLAKAS